MTNEYELRDTTTGNDPDRSSAGRDRLTYRTKFEAIVNCDDSVAR